MFRYDLDFWFDFCFLFDFNGKNVNYKVIEVAEHDYDIGFDQFDIVGMFLVRILIFFISM